MTFFNFNLNLQLFRYLGRLFTKPKNFALAKVYVKPLDLIKADVVDTRNRLVRQLSYSVSTIVVEKMLNDEFDSVLKRIRIQNLKNNFHHAVVRNISEGAGPDSPPETLVVRNISEAQVMLPTYPRVFNISETGQELSFLVLVSNDITFDQNKMILLVNRYRTAGKTWGIWNTDLPESTITRITTFNTSE